MVRVCHGREGSASPEPARPSAQGTIATTRAGPPLPPVIFMGRAMTQAPVAMISALRESSILFALLISVFLLRERVPRTRWLGASLIVGGVLALRLA